MNKIKRSMLEWTVVAAMISSAVFSFNRVMEKIEDRIRSIRKQRLIYEAVCGDINNIVRYPNLCSEERVQEIIEDAIYSADSYNSLYIENLEKSIRKFYEDIKCSWNIEQQKIEKNSLEIKNYMINYMEQNHKKYEMLPDRGHFLDRG